MRVTARLGAGRFTYVQKLILYPKWEDRGNDHHQPGLVSRIRVSHHFVAPREQQMPGAATKAMRRHRGGAATPQMLCYRRNPAGGWGWRPISALLIVDDAQRHRLLLSP